MCLSFVKNTVGASLDMLLKYLLMKGLGNFRVMVITVGKLGLVWDWSWLLSLSLFQVWISTSSFQSDDMENSSRNIFQVLCRLHYIWYVQLSVQGLQVKWVKVWVWCPLTDFLVWGSGWLLHLLHPWLFQEWMPNISEWPQKVVLCLFFWI